MRTNAQWRTFLLEDGSPVATDRQGCADSRIFSDKSAQPAALQWPSVVNRAECVQACRGVVWGGEIPAKGGKKQLRDLGQFALLLHWLQKHANAENWRGWQRVLFMTGAASLCALKPFAFFCCCLEANLLLFCLFLGRPVWFERVSRILPELQVRSVEARQATAQQERSPAF